MTLVGSIRHADLILLSGIFNKKAAIRAKRLYEQAPKPVRGHRHRRLSVHRNHVSRLLQLGRTARRLHPDRCLCAGCPPKPEAMIAGVIKVIEGAATVANWCRSRKLKNGRDRNATGSETG